MSTMPDSLSPALERVLEKFGGVVRRVCWRYRFAGSDVDELMQEVRIRLWHAHGGNEHADQALAAIPAAYLHRTALSAAVDLLRRRRARRVDVTVSFDDEPEVMTTTPAPDAGLGESDLAEQVERAVQSIQPSRRPVVRMHLMGHSREEIARTLGWSESKVRNLLYRGLADVREHLLAEGVRWTTSET
jgi:RNA polymerase sigma-70 factor (ECF subfamily)